MDRHSFSSIIVSSGLFHIFILLFSSEKSLCLDPKYEACAPKMCGGLNISFPFYIFGQQEPNCGYPGYGLNCSNGSAIISVSDNPYVIEQLSYSNSTFRVYNNAVSSPTNGSCIPKIKNFTLDTARFSFASDVSYMYLLSNCPSLQPENLSCLAPRQCGSSVLAPLQLDRDYGINGTITYETLPQGTITYETLPQGPFNYSMECGQSGGRCGFDAETFCSSIYHSDVSYLYLLSNCSSPPPGNLSCLAARQCGSSVVAPVELDRDYGSNATGVYQQLLRRGFSLKWKARNCSECEESGGRCGFDAETSSFSCYCPDRSHARICIAEKKGQILIPIITGATAGLVVVTLVTLFCCIRKRFSRFLTLWRKKREGNHNIEVFLKNHGALALKRYTYSNVKKMTNSFKVKLGQGGYGSVYGGKLPDGNPVAVKVLSQLKGNGQEFINEVASISRTSHVNIVTLLGFCVEGSKRALIYEFMANGSLEKFVFGRSEGSFIVRQLGWDILYKIAVGIARGLEYLHRGCNTRILHFDIKPHNILLDENFRPKISDFGLAKICLKQESVLSKVTGRGTIGYIAPEVCYRNFGRVSHKADVYSYGVLVLEMVSGRKNIEVEVDHTSEIYFPEWIYHRLEQSEELGLQGITNEDENETARKMIIVSLWCIQMDPSVRPSMNKVVEMLEGSLESLEIPPKPFLSSPLRSPIDPSSVREAS